MGRFKPERRGMEGMLTWRRKGFVSIVLLTAAVMETRAFLVSAFRIAPAPSMRPPTRRTDRIRPADTETLFGPPPERRITAMANSPTPSHHRRANKATTVMRMAVDSSSLGAPGAGIGLVPSLIATAAQTMAALSKTAVTDPASALATITDAASTTPPIAYFLALMAAGVGAPVSEDALCIFAGTFLTTLPSERRLPLLLALYLGVVLSDCWTFFLGRSLRLGVLDPVRRRLGLLSDEDEAVCDLTHHPPHPVEFGPDGIMMKGAKVNTTALALSETLVECEPQRRRKRDRLRAKLERSGNYVGFVIRLSVGVRGPLMLLTGFRGKVPFAKFVLGTAFGGVVSLGLQLLLGYSMRNNPAAVVGTVTSIGAVVYAGPIVVAVLSSLGLLLKRMGKQDESSS